MGTYEKIDLEAYRKEDPTNTQNKIKQNLDLGQNVSGEKRMQDLNMDELRTFRYNHLCDKWNRANSKNHDDEDLLWEPIAIQSHFNLRYKENDKLHFQVLWLNGKTSIQKGEPFMQENPEITCKYAANKKITSDKSFKWVNAY